MAGEERKDEADVQEDGNQARTRAEGGGENSDHPDQGSTTSTTPSGSFVGRVVGQDVGYAEKTGAERRVAADRESEQADRESDDSFPASDPPANY